MVALLCRERSRQKNRLLGTRSSPTQSLKPTMGSSDLPHYEATERDFEVHHLNNASHTDDLFKDELFRDGLFLFRGPARSTEEDIDEADSLMPAETRGGYANTPDPMWGLSDASTAWPMAKGHLSSRKSDLVVRPPESPRRAGEDAREEGCHRRRACSMSVGRRTHRGRPIQEASPLASLGLRYLHCREQTLRSLPRAAERPPGILAHLMRRLSDPM